MTKVGIGKIKNAKANIPVQNKKKELKLNAREHQKVAAKLNKDESKKKQEGQLAVDIIQTADLMTVICPIAGVNKADIKVAIQDDVLTIRGERKEIDMPNGQQALVRELFWGTFSRSIVLPDHIDRKNIEARVHEHMLIITIPKTEDFKTRIIHINSEE